MKIIEKIKEKQKDIDNVRQPVLAFLGDSVTQGCFDIHQYKEWLAVETKAEEAYHEDVRKILSLLYPTTPVVIVNAGISGDRAVTGFGRIQRDVLSYNPDLVVFCYGLNDASQGENGLEEYKKSIENIINEVKNSGAELIFLTPNLRTTELTTKRMSELFNNIANDVAKNENEGWLEKYLTEAVKICENNNVPVCDCNKLWKVLKDNDVNINNILSNEINHPTKELHWMFAYELVKTMFLN